jgi:TRAP-type C4-dicarboxylate transport system substrate-binding protein
MSRIQRVTRTGRKLWPLMLMAWERWQKLPQHEKDRYKRQAREYAERGRRAVQQRKRKK